MDTITTSNKWSSLTALNVEDSKLKQIPWTKYYQMEYEKRQIVLHDTISGPGHRGDLATWKQYKSNIATAVLISRDGTINQLFSSRYFGYHLGCGNSNLDKHSIAIELDNWGPLEEKDGNIYTIYGNQINVDTTHFPKGFRGEQLFEAYSDAQLYSLGELLILWNKTYGIPLDYNEDMWDVSDKALNDIPGIWAHVSYRPYPAKRNKWDAHPDPQLIEMLKTIANKN